MTLQILIPHYTESAEVIKPLLDSIAIQQNVDFKEIGVIICHDGTQDLELGEYPFDIRQISKEHSGVSATRNRALDEAEADYVMFCDIDDMFYNACGLWILFREMAVGFDALISVFTEETRDPVSKEPIYINRGMDSTFVHGKVYRREYLIKEGIRFNPNLTIHEDSYFNCLAQKCSENVKFCPTPFYLWKWRDESVCRHDPKYILKTYNNMLDSNTALVKELLRRGKKEDAQFYSVSMIYDAYFTMNKAEWINQENKEYRKKTELRFKDYYREFKELFDSIPEPNKAQIIIGVKNRFYGEGLLMESITFDDWIKHIEMMEGE